MAAAGVIVGSLHGGSSSRYSLNFSEHKETSGRHSRYSGRSLGSDKSITSARSGRSGKSGGGSSNGRDAANGNNVLQGLEDLCEDPGKIDGAQGNGLEDCEDRFGGDQHHISQQSPGGGLSRYMTRFSSTASGGTDSERPLPDRILSSSWFEVMISMVIVANSITIGVEQQVSLQGEDTRTLGVLEHFFLCIYIIELGLRLWADGPNIVKDRWVQFDIILVFFGVTTEWILQIPFCGGRRCDASGWSFVMVLRTTRLFRVARTVKFLIKFRELWMLVRGLIDSVSTMLYTLVMMFIILYMFSAIGVELITKHRFANPGSPEYDEEFAYHVSLTFADLPQTMLTLLQFATLDSVHAVYLPLVRKDPVLVLYFLCLIVVVSIVLMNLITAVVVNSALEQAYQDKELMKAQEEKERKALVRDLKKIFIRLDEDASGEVCESEIANISDEDKAHLEQVLAVADPVEIFHMLDVDRSGSVGIDEFCDGIWQVASQKGNLTTKRIEKKVDSVRTRLDGQEHVEERILKVLNSLAEACRHLTSDRRASPRKVIVSTSNGTDKPKHENSDSLSPRSITASMDSEAIKPPPMMDGESTWAKGWKEVLKASLPDNQASKAAPVRPQLREGLDQAAPVWAVDLSATMREIKSGMLTLTQALLSKEATCVFADIASSKERDFSPNIDSSCKVDASCFKKIERVWADDLPLRVHRGTHLWRPDYSLPQLSQELTFAESEIFSASRGRQSEQPHLAPMAQESRVSISGAQGDQKAPLGQPSDKEFWAVSDAASSPCKTGIPRGR